MLRECPRGRNATSQSRMFAVMLCGVTVITHIITSISYCVVCLYAFKSKYDIIVRGAYPNVVITVII